MGWIYDAGVAPGWADYLGLALTVAGFWIAIAQLRKTRRAADAAGGALREAQAHLAQRSVMAFVAQFQGVITDLGHTMPTNDSSTTQRVLVRFGLMAKEASGVVSFFGTDQETLRQRLVKAAESATRVKGSLASTASPDVVKTVKQISKEIESLTQDLTELASTIRNTLEGSIDVH